MTFHAGDPGHIKAHNDLRAAVLTEAARFGVTLPHLAGPFVGNEPDHIGVHNTIAHAIRAIATAGGIDIDADFAAIGESFPDVAHLGDPGHPADHNALVDAVELIQLSPAWNSATGGTVTEYTNGTGEKWRVHTFTTSGTLDVAIGAQDFRVFAIGGGGGGSAVHHAHGSPAAGGGANHVDVSIPIVPGVKQIDVGAGGGGGYGGDSPQAAATYDGGPGTPSGIAYVIDAAGGGAGRNSSTDAPNMPEVTTTIRGTSETFGGQVGGLAPGSRPGQGGGGSQSSTNGAQSGGKGANGLVIVAYRIG